MPSGSPIAKDRNTAPSVIARVSIVNVHIPSIPQANSSAIDSKRRAQIRRGEHDVPDEREHSEPPDERDDVRQAPGTEITLRMTSMKPSTTTRMGLKK